jgi:hypothetical protein
MKNPFLANRSLPGLLDYAGQISGEWTNVFGRGLVVERLPERKPTAESKKLEEFL